MRATRWLRGGLAVLFCCLSWVAVASAADKPDEKAPAPANAPQPCQLCHERESQQWELSPHARSMSAVFLKEWEMKGKDDECLVCHSRTYAHKEADVQEIGVSCESCHGEDNTDHPNKAQMSIPTSSETCHSCHGETWAQWQTSAHGQNNIRCFDCHKMHQTDLRKTDPDEQCGSCHPQVLKDFATATHHINGGQCITCHMPEPQGVMKMEGSGVRSHTFKVDARVCIDCHWETMHRGKEPVGLQE